MSDDKKREKEELTLSEALIIDDSNTVRMRVTNMLQERGFKCTTAVDGEDGIQKIKENENFKLIFCDLSMPNLDGISMLKRIKSEKILMGGKKSLPPVILITTENSKESIEHAKYLGVKGWVVKPLKDDILNKIVNTFISKNSA